MKAKGSNGKRAIDSRMLEALPIPTLAVDGEGTISFWSAGLADLTGLSAREAIGRRPAEIWNGSENGNGEGPKSSAATPVDLAISSAKPQSAADFLLTDRRTRGVRHVRFAAQPVFDEKEGVVGAWATLTETGPGESVNGADEDRPVLEEIRRLVEATMEGRLDVRCDASRFSGSSAELLVVVNEMLDEIVKPLRLASGAIEQIAHGKIPEFITEDCKGQLDDTKRNVNTFLATMYGMHHETRSLVEAIKTGALNTRGNDWDFEGNWQELVAGMNEVIDAFVNPFRLTADYVDRVARGDIPEKITEKYRGDFNHIKKNLNRLIETLSSFIAEMGKMGREHKAGETDAVIPEEKFSGAYREMAAGVNQGIRIHIDNLLKVLDIVKSYAEGEFAPVLETLPGKQAIANEKMNLLRTNLRSVVAELANLAAAAVEGKLDTRVDAERFQGDWRGLVRGINDTLDAVIDPIKEASAVLDQLADYDLRARMQGEYRGDHARIKKALNATAEALHDALAQVAKTAADVSAAGARIAASSQEVAGGAARQARSIEETSANLAEIAAACKQNAARAEDARVIFQQAKQSVDAGMATAVQMTEAMGAIRGSAEGTQTIIQEINEIARRTDDLAVNASQEANRVSEAGRGFSVVAEEVRRLARRCKDAASKMEKLARSMGRSGQQTEAAEIQASLESTMTIINEIHEIALQSNYLALNAAVEAAHVGAAGDGIAVVADEVRGLAQRSKEAAAKSEGLIQASVDVARQGEGLSGEIHRNLTNLVDAVTMVTSLVDQIATASQEQTRGVEAVSSAVAETMSVTKQNASMAEQSLDAARALAGQTQALAERVCRFQLGSSGEQA